VYQSLSEIALSRPLLDEGIHFETVYIAKLLCFREEQIQGDRVGRQASSVKIRLHSVAADQHTGLFASRHATAANFDRAGDSGHVMNICHRVTLGGSNTLDRLKKRFRAREIGDSRVISSFSYYIDIYI
jgi:hypothetical protein